MGFLGKLFGNRRNNIIKQTISEVYTLTPGVTVNTDIYFDAAKAFAKDHNIKQIWESDVMSARFIMEMMIHGKNVQVTLSRNRVHDTMQIFAVPDTIQK